MSQGHQHGAVNFPGGNCRKQEHLSQRYGLLFLVDGAMNQGIEDSSTDGALGIAGPTDKQQVDLVCASGKVGRLGDSKSRQGIGSKHWAN